MRSLPIILLLSTLTLPLSSFTQSASEFTQNAKLAEQYPFIDKKCTLTLEKFGEKPTWRAKCRLYVYRKTEGDWTEGVTLFELPLVQGQPAKFSEASRAVQIWLEKSSVEILKRNGYLKEKDGKEKK